jgi:hypothetical protein
VDRKKKKALDSSVFHHAAMPADKDWATVCVCSGHPDETTLPRPDVKK